MMTPEELDEQIHWEAEQHIPFDIKVMSIDYEVSASRPEAGQMDLLLVAAKKDEINDYASNPPRGEAQAGVVDINAFTIQNMFEQQPGCPRTAPSPSSTSAPRSRRSTSSRKGVSAFTREITNAGTRSPKRSERQLRRARTSRPRPTRCGGGPTQMVPQEVHQVISQACDALAGEIQRSLDFYLATSGETRDQPHLRLGRERVPRAAQRHREAGARARQLFDPMVNLAVDTSRSTRPRCARWAAQMVVALGLSLRCDKERRQ